MNITVEQKHIRRGEKQNGQRCPLALAVKENAPAEYCHVGTRWLHLDRDAIAIRLSTDMMLFVLEFDRGQKVYPQTFLNVPIPR